MEVAEAAGPPAPALEGGGMDERSRVPLYLPRLLASVVSGALTGIFALGTCTAPPFRPSAHLA
jgi:hypothetical protein